MRVWALSDLHLSESGSKPMDVFGARWADHAGRMAAAWDACVAPDDLVLSPGDVSWALRPAEAAIDLAWIEARPGHKVIVKGNHDLWWPKTRSKLDALLPPSVQGIKRNALRIGPVALFGARGGDWRPFPEHGDERSQAEIDAWLDREEAELDASIADLALRSEGLEPAALTICCFHYPPIPPGQTRSRFTARIRDAGATLCVYGHLHGADPARVEGRIDGVRYVCASCDLIGFEPLLVAEV